jgi:DNA-binding transcriptional regulator GbsR (MarR family)
MADGRSAPLRLLRRTTHLRAGRQATVNGRAPALRQPASCPSSPFSHFQKYLKFEERMNLPPLIQAFVLHFGEMGSRWGINRTVGQIYAVLFVAERPLCADDIVERLGVSRSNVSMGLKELQGWNLVRLQHQPGERREFFSTPDDIWLIVRTLVEERKKREIDPTLSMLRELLMQTPNNADERHAQERIREMHALIELLTGWYADVQRLETERLVQLLSLGSKVVKALDIKDRLFALPGGRKDRPATLRPDAGGAQTNTGNGG